METSMKKLIYVMILGMLAFILTGCEKKETLSYDYDYNQEPVFNERLAWTPKGLYSIDNKILYYTSPDGKMRVLCSKPECKHGGGSCEAYIETDNLFFYHNKLCYMVLDMDHHKTTIYTMNDKGKERKKYFTVEFPDDFKEERQEGNEGWGYSSKISGNLYVQEIDSTTDKILKKRTYLTNLDEPSKSIVIDTESMGGGTAYKIGKEWIIFININPKTQKSTLWGYNIKTKEQRVLVNRTNFTFKNAWITGVKIKGDDLYWYEYGLGFCKKNIKEELDPDKKTTFLALAQEEQIGIGDMGKENLILCNMKSQLNPIPEDKEGISFYSYEGKLLQFVSTKNHDYKYYMETEDKFYFIDYASGNSHDFPKAYIEKARIKEGKAKIIQIKKYD